MSKSYPGDYDRIVCENCKEKKSRSIMVSDSIKTEKGTSMCVFYCPQCQ